MSENNDYGKDDDSNGINHTRRRTVLAAIAGAIGVGGYLKRDDIRDYGKDLRYREGTGPAIDSGGTPPQSAEEANPSGPHFSWEKDTLTITSIQGHYLRNVPESYGRESFQNAITFWNDYLSENTDEDLTLNYEADASNPDIEITISRSNQMTDQTQYTLPSTGRVGLQTYVRVETLTENPVTSDETNGSGDNLPIRGQVNDGGGSQAVRNYITKHVLGRLLGFEIWSDPVDVMTPEHLFGPSKEYGQDVHSPFNAVDENAGDILESLADYASERISTYPSMTPSGLRIEIESTHGYLIERKEQFENTIDQFYLQVIEQAMENNPNYITLNPYIEAYEETVRSDEIAHLEETIAHLDEMLTEIEPVDNSEIRELDSYTTLIDRYEAMEQWPSNDPLSPRMHQYATSVYWSDYNWSNPPTPVSTEEE
jgi:hypothetical protein